MQTIIHGLEGLTPVLAGKRVFLVRDGAYDYLPVKGFLDALDPVVFADFTPNPLYDQVCAGVRRFNEGRCDVIVAVGGGSAIDVAKCIKLYCRMDPAVNYLTQEMKDSGVMLIAVPTTAGTGSESTRHAVIYYQGAKQSVSHPSIIPDIAVLEPAVLRTLPLYQKKCTMLDALCQAIESMWSVHATEESKDYSRAAIAGIRDNWEAYIFGNSPDAAEKIMRAANCAGQAINITATTAAHAMSYKLTSLYGLPHGHAVAVCMAEVWPYILDHTDECIDSRGPAYLRETMAEIGGMFSPDRFRDMMARMEMAQPRSEARAQELDALAASVNPVRLKNNPVELGGEVVKDMYRRIVKE